MIRIVIVEDEIRIRDGLKKLIPKIDSDYRIVGEAVDGKEGFRVAKKTNPDLIITDVCMPELNGLEMINNLIKANFKFKTIILSAYSEFPYAQKAISLGVSEYLLKPINVADLRKCLQNIKAELTLEKKSTIEGQEFFVSLDDIFYQLLFRAFSLNPEVEELLKERFKIDLDSKFIEIILYLGDNYSELKDKIIRRSNKVLNKKYANQYSLIKLEQEQSLLLIFF